LIYPGGHNRHGPKIGGCALLGGELGPHLTQCRLGPGLYLRTYGILIRPAVWPQ